MVTVFCWLLALRARTNPPRVCLMAELMDSMSARWLYVFLLNFCSASLRLDGSPSSCRRDWENFLKGM